MTTDPARRHTIRPRSRLLATVAGVLVATTVMAAPAAPAASAAPAEPTAPAAPTAGTPTQVPDRFEGTVDEFYVVPDPLPAGEPGELIRVQDVTSGGGTTTLRIMYHSRDAADRDRAVTGIVTFPDGPAPPGGWPVVSIAPGTSGLSSPCAVSRQNSPSFAFGLDAVSVTTDYIGLGPVGETHPYLSKPSEAHSVIDAVRAARNLTETGAGDEWLAFGHSQGGHAALAANELAGEYAPELDLHGTVASAPAALFERNYGPLDEVVSRIVGVMALYGAASEHDEIDPDDYVTPQTAAAAAAVFPDGCLGEIITTFLAVPGDQFWSHPPAQTEPARSIVRANDVGGVVGESPVFMIAGTADDRVVIERARDTFDTLCETGQVTEYLEHEGGTHGDVVPRSLAQITAFFEARLAGDEPVDSCTGGSAPTTPTTTAPVLPTAPPAAPRPATPTYTG